MVQFGIELSVLVLLEIVALCFGADVTVGSLRLVEGSLCVAVGLVWFFNLLELFSDVRAPVGKALLLNVWSRPRQICNSHLRVGANVGVLRRWITLRLALMLALARLRLNIVLAGAL